MIYKIQQMRRIIVFSEKNLGYLQFLESQGWSVATLLVFFFFSYYRLHSKGWSVFVTFKGMVNVFFIAEKF
jgi:hypothetical protein